MRRVCEVSCLARGKPADDSEAVVEVLMFACGKPAQ